MKTVVDNCGSDDRHPASAMMESVRDDGGIDNGGSDSSVWQRRWKKQPANIIWCAGGDGRWQRLGEKRWQWRGSDDGDERYEGSGTKRWQDSNDGRLQWR